MDIELVTNEDGVYVRKFDKKGMEKSFEFVCNHFDIVRYQPIESIWSVTLKWNDNDGQSHEATFSMGDVYSGTKIFKAMASGGFCYSPQNIKFVRMHIIDRLPSCSRD